MPRLLNYIVAIYLIVTGLRLQIPSLGLGASKAVPYTPKVGS